VCSPRRGFGGGGAQRATRSCQGAFEPAAGCGASVTATRNCCSSVLIGRRQPQLGQQAVELGAGDLFAVVGLPKVMGAVVVMAGSERQVTGR
jgi:hypothetical protein